MSDIYSLVSGQFLENLYSVDNVFIRQLANISIQQAQQLKMVQFVQNNMVSNRGDVTDTTIKSKDKSVLNMNKLPALGYDFGNGLKCKTLAEEIANYRFNMLNLDFVDDSFAKKHEDLLVIDYLLSSCVCYIEVFDNTAKVQKFFATRNRFIAGSLSGLEAKETTKYINYLTPLRADYELGSLRVLKLNMSKSGVFKIVQPRSGLNFATSTIKVTPLFLMTAFIQGVTPALESNIIRFKYIKDNLTERTLETTLSRDIMQKYYNDMEFTDNVLKRCETRIERGFARLPEIGLSRYDATGVRSLNISRITGIEAIDSVDSSFIDVDFDLIIPSFKLVVETLTSLNYLGILYGEFSLDFDPTMDILNLRNNLLSHVDSMYAIGTTSFQRHIHSIMTQNEYMFPSYRGGKPISYSGLGSDGTGTMFSSSFNLGCE